MKSKLSEIEGQHKRQLQSLSNFHNAQVSNLKEEIAQLRNRLIRKAEVVSEMESTKRVSQNDFLKSRKRTKKFIKFITGLGNLSTENRVRDRFSGSKSGQVT